LSGSGLKFSNAELINLIGGAHHGEAASPREPNGHHPTARG
jgi:hypothetical protein